MRSKLTARAWWWLSLWMDDAAADFACENGHDLVVAYLLSLLTRQPAARKADAEKLRRGSALFLAQQGQHSGVVQLIETHPTS